METTQAKSAVRTYRARNYLASGFDREAILSRIEVLRKESRTYGQIAMALNKEGFETAFGLKFTAARVQATVKNHLTFKNTNKGFKADVTVRDVEEPSETSASGLRLSFDYDLRVSLTKALLESRLPAESVELLIKQIWS